MSKDIKEYLKYYIGQSWQVTQLVGTFESGIYGTDIFNSLLLRELGLGNVDIKPILRKLESMTEEEGVELAAIHKYDIPEDEGVREELIGIYTFDDGVLRIGTTCLPGKMFIAGLHYLLSRGFDLFNLIPEGLAIDKETLK